jgi:D-3-phosphoglycerate dehydrogenase
MPDCLIVQPIHPAGLDLLREHGVTPRLASAADPATVARELPGCAAVITRNAGLKTAAMRAADSLRVIANHGVGTNNIDLASAAELGIPVVFTPTTNARSVAEHAMALILALARKVIPADAAVRRLDWTLRYEAKMMELHGRTLGLAGFGTIGRMTGAIARNGFGMKLLVFSPATGDAALVEDGAERAPTLEALLSRSDVVSLHRPLRPDTENMIDAAALSRMQPHALLVNTARGGLVDGAALDVFHTEPTPAGDPVMDAPNTVLAPHIAGVTEAAMRETALQCASQVLDALAGRRPPHLVQPEIWDRRRGATP